MIKIAKSFWASTNESLEAIVKGLDLQPTDNVLAVCGGGDQAFAILEYTNSVLAFDTSLDQILYARKRKIDLETGISSNSMQHRISQLFIIDKDLTQKAITIQRIFNPTVYRKSVVN